jgi:hypothetical protein
MGDLTLHSVTSIKVEKTVQDDSYSLIRVRIEGDSMDGPSYFTVNLFGKPSLIVETDAVQIFKGDNSIKIMEEVNAA